MGEFEPEFAGKMNFYLAAVDDKLRTKGDSSSIGLILCRGNNGLVVEYALRGMNKPMAVSEYAVLPPEIARALPSPDVLEAGLEYRLEIRDESDDGDGSGGGMSGGPRSVPMRCWPVPASPLPGQINISSCLASPDRAIAAARYAECDRSLWIQRMPPSRALMSSTLRSRSTARPGRLRNSRVSMQGRSLRKP
nr:PDDEXK nuclease domain-containing protein [Bosea thiooxidans]